MIIKIKRELFYELMEECTNAQELLFITDKVIKDLDVRALLDRHFVTLQMYHDYLRTIGSIYEDGELKYCVDILEFGTVVSLVGYICPCATALSQEIYSEPDV